jgi:hypothetical protein
MIRPCCVSMVCSSIPLALLKRGLLFKIHLGALNISSIIHHSHHRIGSVQYWVDKCLVWSFCLHGALITQRQIQYFAWCLATWGVFQFSKRCNQHDSFRGWDHMSNVVPHMVTHCVMGTGMYLSLK